MQNVADGWDARCPEGEFRFHRYTLKKYLKFLHISLLKSIFFQKIVFMKNVASFLDKRKFMFVNEVPLFLSIQEFVCMNEFV